MWELTKSFRFEAAHSLRGTTLGETSEEIHGHSYRAEVTIRGTPDPETGMLIDVGVLERQLADIRKKLDHKLLDRIQAIGPATLENLSRFIWDSVQHTGHVVRVSVHRDSCGESCTYFGPQSQVKSDGR
ncbi:MAG: 6-carboxytetrahydropterin synthase [Rhizobiales bacterium]|nr:6-carboxytetrahydropterin synthase [Hyphomicrobiales bacterium]